MNLGDPETEATPADGVEEQEGVRKDSGPAEPAAGPGTGLDVTALGTEALRELVAELEEQANHLQDQVLRRQAELINYRRRVERERVELAAIAQAEMLRQLLPAIDDLERAIESDSQDLDSYHEGMKLIRRSLESILEKLGVERIEPTGQPFDPNRHEAVARHETDEVPDGQVIEVYQPGYRLEERLVRPATVAVAAAPAGPTDDREAGDADESDAEREEKGSDDLERRARNADTRR